MVQPAHHARPAWFNPGGGYASQVRNDGQAGWATSKWGLISYGKQDVTEDLRDAEGNLQKKADPDCQNDCVLINASDGILDWQYTSYDAAEAPDGIATLGWGLWNDLSPAMQEVVAGLTLPSYAEMAAELGSVGTGEAIIPASGTATYEGEAVGVFRPDWFGTIYGRYDDPDTPDVNEYDDAVPCVRLTAHFDKGYIDGELTARLTTPLADGVCGHDCVTWLGSQTELNFMRTTN
ncbi:MAG: hypothetical protein F4Z73_07290 [Synechococcus sp. SB0668_bin_13]|nr:hypothetical protein [Synechococcus sp. SB0668_bin_13]